MTRVANATRNIIFGYIGNTIALLLGFVSRTVFIHTLGVTYLGVDGLYTNILSLLSLAELGIGTAMNFNLYKPVAEEDYEKIKSLMYVYKRAYMVIAVFITIIGLAFVPFLRYIIKERGSLDINNLTIYYLIFLFNTVSTYFVSYKYSLVNAEQKGYIQTNINTITTSITVISQIIVLLIFKSFLLYLITASVIGLLEKIIVSLYMNKRYPYLSDGNVRKLSNQDVCSLKKNIKALMYHKIGDASVHQTDNIIISSFISVRMVGLISNYHLVINSISRFVNIIFNSAVGGLGNLVATERKERQYRTFKNYRFLGFWVYGFCAVALLTLLSPFITLWLGKDMLVSDTVIYLIIADFYFRGHRIVVNNFKTAAGIFDEDKYVGFIQGIVNLVVSLILVQRIGLVGIYIGTICSGLVGTVIKPRIVYREIFRISEWDYYYDSLRFGVVVALAAIILESLKRLFVTEVTVVAFFWMVLGVVLVPNCLFYLFFRHRDEFQYLTSLVKNWTARRGLWIS